MKPIIRTNTELGFDRGDVEGKKHVEGCSKDGLVSAQDYIQMQVEEQKRAGTAAAATASEGRQALAEGGTAAATAAATAMEGMTQRRPSIF